MEGQVNWVDFRNFEACVTRKTSELGERRNRRRKEGREKVPSKWMG